MTIKEYFKLTKSNSSRLIQIIGVIYTILFAFILIIANYNKSLTDVFNNFIIIFLIANGFAFLVWSLSFFDSYFNVKRMLFFYESFQSQKLNIFLTLHEEQRRKSDLLNFFVIGIYSEHIYRFTLDKDFVYVTLYLNLDDIERFPRRASAIRVKYTKLSLDLTGYGLMRQIKLKRWQRYSSEDIITLLDELENISNIEKIPIIKYDEEA